MRIDELKNGLMVSCQPVPGGPMDNAETVVAFALAAFVGGAVAPIVGILMDDRPDTPVRVTPTIGQAVALCETGADIAAFAATRRPRIDSVRDIVTAIKQRGRFAMADCSDLEDARAALEAARTAGHADPQPAKIPQPLKGR